MSPEITWRGPPIAEPATGVGDSVRVRSDWSPGLRDGEPLKLAAYERGITFGATWRGRGMVGRISVTKRLREVVSDDTTLDEQAESIVRWGRSSLQLLSELSPDT